MTMKNLLKLLVCLFMLGSTCQVTHAEEVEINPSDYNPTAEELARKNENNAKAIVRAQANAKTRAVKSKKLAITKAHYEQQPDQKTCGPASGKIILLYKGVKNITIDDVASEMGTKNNGTTLEGVVSGLNAYLGTKYDSYSLYDKHDLKAITETSILDDYPLMYDVKMNKLPGYGTIGDNVNHWIVGYGYNWTTNKFNIIDPNKSAFTAQTLSYTTLDAAIRAVENTKPYSYGFFVGETGF